MMRKWIILPLVIALAACGKDDKEKAATPTPPAAFQPGGGGPTLNTGPEIEPTTGSDSVIGGQLPGCSDPNSDECPTPLVLDLDGDASAGGITVQYPTRYFTAATHETGDILIEITPSENNKFEDKATFQLYYAESVDAALAELTDPITADWQTETFKEGKIGVVKDATQDPQVNTSIGAFALSDGRAVVFKAITTGEYGWELYSELYRGMLNSLSVSE